MKVRHEDRIDWLRLRQNLWKAYVAKPDPISLKAIYWGMCIAGLWDEVKEEDGLKLLPSLIHRAKDILESEAA